MWHLSGETPGILSYGSILKREGIDTQLWLIHIVVRLEATQQCKAIFIQLKCKINFKHLIEVQLIYSVVLISAVQESDSVMHIYIFMYIYLHIYILFHYGLSEDIECSCLCYTEDLVVHPSYKYCFASVNPKLPVLPSPDPLGKHKSVLCLEVCFVSQIRSVVSYFRFHI